MQAVHGILHRAVRDMRMIAASRQLQACEAPGDALRAHNDAQAITSGAAGVCHWQLLAVSGGVHCGCYGCATLLPELQVCVDLAWDCLWSLLRSAG